MKAVLVVVLAAALALPASAAAAPISLTAQGTGVRIALGGSTRVVISRVGNNVYVQGAAGDTWSASACTAGAGYYDCGASLTGITFVGSTGSDELAVSSDITVPITATGNGGDDELNGAAGNDTLSGDNGADLLRGGAGNDTLNGGDGGDVILGEPGVDAVDGGTGDDTLFGGGQVGDRLTYASRTAPVIIDLPGGTAGAAGETDRVMDFTAATGGQGADTLIGGPGAQQLDGSGGNDTVSGGPGADSLVGGSGNDFLDARDAAADTMTTCGTGADRLANDLVDPAASDCEVVAPNVLGTVTVTGTPQEGSTLTPVFDGRVTGTASASSWRWSRCNAVGCWTLGEAPTYTLAAADVGTTLIATLVATNAAGAGELRSAPSAPVIALPALPQAAPPPAATPAPVPVPAGLSVRSARCSGKRCTLTVRLTGDVARLRAVLSRGKTTVASATRAAPTGTVTVRVTAKRTLRAGTYRLKTTVTGTDGTSKSSTRTIRIRRR